MSKENNNYDYYPVDHSKINLVSNGSYFYGIKIYPNSETLSIDWTKNHDNNNN